MISVAIVGHGTIGGKVARSLAAGTVPGARLAGIVTRDGSSVPPAATGPSLSPAGDPLSSVGDPLSGARHPLSSAGHPLSWAAPSLSLPLARAVAEADLVVEAASQQALAEIAPKALAGRAGLLVVSVGALRNDDVLKPLASAPPGRVHLATGAVGGLDMLRSAARMGPLRRVRIVTTKRPAALLQPWMTDAERDTLRGATGPVEVRRGPARQITGLFPTSANVAAAVALAAGSWDATEAVVMADPGTPLTSHVITASGPAGEYRFEIRNRPSPDNPKSSEVVSYAVLKAIEDIAGSAPWSFR